MHSSDRRATALTHAGLVILALCTITGCDAWLTKPSLYNTVAVQVTRRDGEGIPGANLTLYTGQRPMGYGTTAGDGRFTFTRVPQGLYGVLAAPPAGYALVETLLGGPASDVVENLEVANDTLGPVHFTFLKVGNGDVVVRVLDTSGKPLAGVKAQLYTPTQNLDTLVTDATGTAVFQNEPFGVYGVVITRPVLYNAYIQANDSLLSFRSPIIVEAGSRDSARFVLRKCSEQIRFHVADAQGNPVPGALSYVYTSTAVLDFATSGPDGTGLFREVPCATVLGAYIIPPTGYTVQPGRGHQYIDGLLPQPNVPLDITFTLQK